MGQGSVLESPEPFGGLQMDSSVRILKQPVQSLMFPSGTMTRSPLLLLMAPRVVSFTMRMVRSLLLSPASGLFSMPLLFSRRRIVRLRGFPVTSPNRTVIWIRSWAFYLLFFSLRFSFLFFRSCFFRLSLSWLLSPSLRCSGSPPWKLAPLIFFLLCTAVHLSGLGGFHLLGCLCRVCLSLLVSLAPYRRLHPYWDIPQSFDCTHVAQYEVVSNPSIRRSPRSRELGTQFFCSRAPRTPTITVKGNPGFAAIAKRGHKPPQNRLFWAQQFRNRFIRPNFLLETQTRPLPHKCMSEERKIYLQWLALLISFASGVKLFCPCSCLRDATGRCMCSMDCLNDPSKSKLMIPGKH